MEIVSRKFLQCPICLLFPPAEVYQCQNGHSVCSVCRLKMRSCPQCRIPFGNQRLRNLQLEALLENRLVRCDHIGCLEKCLKKDLTAHMVTCPYRPTSFCKNIGLECDHVARTPENLVTHLQEDHEIDILPLCEAVTIGDFTTWSDEDLKDLSYSKPWLLYWRQSFAVVCLQTLEGHKDCLIHCVWISDDEDDAGEMQISISLGDKVDPHEKLGWRLTPVHFKESEGISQTSPVRVRMTYLRDNFDGGQPFLVANIAKKTE